MVRNQMMFIGFRDFYKRSRHIKQIYHTLTLEEKWTYKYYVYSNSLIPVDKLDLIWEYLNELDNSDYYISRKKLGEQYLKVRI